MWGKWKFAPRIYTWLPQWCADKGPFTYQWMFTISEPSVDPGQGVERKPPFSPPLHSWHVIGLVLDNLQPALEVPPGKGRQGGERRASGGDCQTGPWLVIMNKL